MGATNQKIGSVKAAYMSMNREEFARLRELGLRERWLYVELKWLANFRTGEVGRFRNQRTTYAKLAERVAVPAAQGRGAETIDRTEAWRLVQRLAAAGLVSDIGARTDNDGIVCKLPLSPITDKTKLQRVAALIEPENPGASAACANSSEPPSVVINKKQINTSIITDAPHGACAAACGAAEPPHSGATQTQTPTPASTPQRSGIAGTLTRDFIERRLKECGFEFVHSERSRALYQRWIDRRITAQQFELAVEQVMDDFLANRWPNSVHDKLGASLRPNRRGRVAL